MLAYTKNVPGKINKKLTIVPLGQETWGIER